MTKKTLRWALKRKKWQAKRKWRLAKRKWRVSSIKLKVFTLSFGLLCLLVAVLLGASLLAPPPQTSLEASREVLIEVTECLKDGNAEAIKVLLSARAATSSFKAESSNRTTISTTEQSKQFPSLLTESGERSNTALPRLIENFDKVQEIARTGKMYFSTEEKGDIVAGTIIINSPHGFYLLEVKLKKINGKWVIVE